MGDRIESDKEIILDSKDDYEYESDINEEKLVVDKSDDDDEIPHVTFHQNFTIYVSHPTCQPTGSMKTVKMFRFVFIGSD